MSIRNRSGSTLAMTAGLVCIICIVGVFLLYLVQLIGGNCELQNATDSGSLNVAKQLSVKPHYMTDPYKISQFLYCCERDKNGKLLFKGGTSNAFPQGQPVVNLRTYNKLVGQALLVAMNAADDGSPQATQHAATLINYLNGKNGIADALTQDVCSLTDPTGTSQTDALHSFGSLYQSNSVRMLNPTRIRQTDSKFAVSYVEQRDSDRGATNLMLPSSDQIPALSGISFDVPKSAGGKYVRGYRGIKFPSIADSSGNAMVLMGVPTQPDEQPHLVSATTFTTNAAKPKGISVPPNAFANSAVQKTRIGRSLHALSYSSIGVLDKKFQPTIPGGYLVVHNPQGNNNGFMGNFDSVLNGPLAYGIEVERGNKDNTIYFTSDTGLLDRWAQYRKDGSTDPSKAPGYKSADGTISGLYSVPAENGIPVAKAKVTPVKYTDAVKNPFTAHCLCNDTNTHSDAAKGGSPICYDMLHAFDTQYTPGFDGNYQVSTNNSNNLTAAETLKADVEHLYNDSGFLKLDAGQNLTTGIRVYNNGIGNNTPWPQWETGSDNSVWRGNGPYKPADYNFPQISHTGNLQDLIRQVCNADTSNPKNPNNAKAQTYIDNFSKFIRNRLAQISGKSGSALDADVQTVMTTAIPMGPDLYIYYSDDGAGNFTQLQALVTTAPPTFGYGLPNNPFSKPGIPNFSNATPDGTPTSDLTVDSTKFWPADFSKDIVFKLVDSVNDHWVDKKPFQLVRGTIGLKQTITLTPSSGFNNLLGEIDLQETASPSPKLYFGQPN